MSMLLNRSLVFVLGVACSLAIANESAVNNIDAQDVASRAQLSLEEQNEIDKRVLESFLRSYQDDTQINALTDSLTDKVLREQAERDIPDEQRSRDESIDPKSSRGPFSVNVYPNHLTIIAFLDSFGEPWPLTAQPVNSNPTAYTLTWSDAAPHIVQISANQPYVQTTVGVMLAGQTLPITFSLKNGNGIQDVSVTYRVLGLAPASRTSVVVTDQQLVTPILSQFVRRDYPERARTMTLTGQTGSLAWEYEDMFVFATRGSLIYPSNPFAVESAVDSDMVYYAFKDVPDAVAIRFGDRALTLGVR